MKSLLSLVAVFTIFCLSVNSQITVDGSVTAAEAMETLLGENVTISNLQYSGASSQLGVFGCIDCGLDFEDGVIFSSGDVELAVGPNDQGAAGLAVGGGSVLDADLTLAEPTNAQFFDLAVLEFDFVALGDSVWFDYVWASDEYPNFINGGAGGGINDQFAFFMSGPGINGPYTDGAENLAVIPGTDLAVTTYNINNGTDGTSGPCANCEYYVHNGTGNPNDPEYTDDSVVQYDGYTTGLRAIQGNLVCGETYHLRIAIADVGDAIYDSAVILKAGSLNSNLTVGIELVVEATNEDGVMNEECGVAELIFTRPESISSDIPFTVNIAYSGTAENGVDYTALPEQIVFDPGVDQISYTLDAFEDGVVEGLETVQMELLSVAVCQGESIPSNFEFGIIESVAPEMTGFDIDICQGASTILEPIIEGGSGGFVYEWSTDETTTSIEVSPLDLTTYSVTLNDTCLATTSTAEFDVDISVFPELGVSTSVSDIDISCEWWGEFLTVTATGGDGTYAYTWLNDEGNSFASGSSFYFSDGSQTELTAVVTDGCGFTAEAIVEIESEVEPLEIIAPESIINCTEDDVLIDIELTGEAPFFINWFNNTTGVYLGSTEDITYTGSGDAILNVSVSDNCGAFQSVTIDVVVPTDVEPLILVEQEDFLAGCEEELTLNSGITSGTEPVQYTWSTSDGVDLGTNPEVIWTMEEDVTILIDVIDACEQTSSDEFTIFLDQIPLEITLPQNLSGDCLDVFELEAVININQDVPMTWSGPFDMVMSDNYNTTYQSLNSGVISVFGDAGCENTAEASTSIDIGSPELTLYTPADTLICEGGTASLSAYATGGSGEYIFEWISEDSFDDQISVSPLFTENYNLSVTDECTNTQSGNVTVEVLDLNVAFTYDFVDFNTYDLTPVINPECENCVLLWEFSDGTQSNEESPQHSFTELSDFEATLSVLTVEGCQADYTEDIFSPTIYIPNSFTPNGDGLNDVFKVEVRGVNEFKIEIFNRWGELVHTSINPEEIWDGSYNLGDHYVPNGVYSYVMTYKVLDTTAEIRKGSISVFR